MVFAIHGHESATGAHVSPHLELPTRLPPPPIPLGCPRAPALSGLLHASNLHWSSILHMVTYMGKPAFKPGHSSALGPALTPLERKYRI